MSYIIPLSAKEVERRLFKIEDLKIHEAILNDKVIEIDVSHFIEEGSEIKFRAPDAGDVTSKLRIKDKDGNSKDFAFADANGNDVGEVNNLFAKDAVVKVILADINGTVENPKLGRAFVQNADTNQYLENELSNAKNRLDSAESRLTGAEDRLTGVETGISDTNKDLDNSKNRITDIETNLGTINKDPSVPFLSITERMCDAERRLGSAATKKDLDDAEERITEIETNLGTRVDGVEEYLGTIHTEQSDMRQTQAAMQKELAKRPKAGFIYPLATENVPDGFLLCDGAEYSRSDYPELFAAIGLEYTRDENGNMYDDGVTFKVPNLQTRVPVGAGDGYKVGDIGGEADHTLTVDQISAHNHIVEFDDPNKLVGYSTGSVEVAESVYFTQGVLTQGARSGTLMTKTVGGNQPHNNMQPYTVVNYIIATGKDTAVSVADIVLGAQAIPLGIEYGGTGATSADIARAQLGITPENIGALSTSGGQLTGPLNLSGPLNLTGELNLSWQNLKGFRALNGMRMGAFRFEKNTTYKIFNITSHWSMLVSVSANGPARALYFVTGIGDNGVECQHQVFGDVELHFGIEEKGVLTVTCNRNHTTCWYIVNSFYEDIDLSQVK